MRTDNVSWTPPTNYAIMYSSNEMAAVSNIDTMIAGLQKGTTTRGSAKAGDAPRFQAAEGRCVEPGSYGSPFLQDCHCFGRAMLHRCSARQWGVFWPIIISAPLN